MSAIGGLHAGKINCLVLRLLVGVGWLGVFARDKLPELSREIRLWCLMLNTNPKDQFGTYCFALYAPIAGGIELFHSFGLCPRIYSLDFLDSVQMSYFL